MKKHLILMSGILMVVVMLFASCSKSTCPAYRGSSASHSSGARK